MIEWLQDGVTCRFDPVEHEYFYGEDEVPGVTKCLEFLSDLSMVPRAVLDRAADRGTYVHQACELLDAGTLDFAKVHPECQPYIKAYECFKAEKKFEPAWWGKPIIAEFEGLRYGATPDVVGLLDGLNTMLDLKCTSVVPKSLGPQLAAYTMSISTLSPGCFQRYGLQLFPDGTYRPYLYESESDFDAWYCALYMAHWEPSKKLTARRKIKK